MKYWFSADAHMGHANILKYTNRTIFMTKEDKEKQELYFQDPDKNNYTVSQESLDRMNLGLIRNWNNRVKKDDIVFHLGDFGFYHPNGKLKGEGSDISMQTFEECLNGKIYFIKGNHDKRSNKTKFIIQNCKINLGGFDIDLVHNPEHGNTNCPIILHGHVHNKWKIKKEKDNYYINVGVDVWNYQPIDIQDILIELSKFKKNESK